MNRTIKVMSASIALLASGALAGATTTTVDFEDGMPHGWEGPQGFGGSSFIDPSGGVGGGAGFRTQFNDFGINFTNSTNDAFTGDYTRFDEVTVSFDLKIDQIGFDGLGINRPFMLELRNTNLGDDGYPYASAYILFDWYTADSFDGFMNLSATFNPNAIDLPTGWGGTGSFNPDTFESQLPHGISFADVLSGVDEIAISTLLPDFFFTNDDYDLTLDNISITTTPAPSALALIGLGGLVGTRRRRTL